MNSHADIVKSLASPAAEEKKTTAPVAMSPFRDDHASTELRIKMAQHLISLCAKSDVKTPPVVVDAKEHPILHSKIDPATVSPDLTIANYFFRLATSLPLTDENFIIALFIINNLSKEIPVDRFTVHRYLLFASYLATDDSHFHTTKFDDHFAKVGGIKTEELLDSCVKIDKMPAMQSCLTSIKQNEHYAMLQLLLHDSDSDYKASICAKSILYPYLSTVLRRLVSSYIFAEDLAGYASYFRLFPVKALEVVEADRAADAKKVISSLPGSSPAA